MLERMSNFSARLQFRVANYQDLLARYNFCINKYHMEFADNLPVDSNNTFMMLISEGQVAINPTHVIVHDCLELWLRGN